MGYARCQYRYGMFVERSTGASESVYSPGTLVAVSEFSGARRWLKGDRKVSSHEWVRYASLKDLRIVGGMGKMLQTFIDDVHPDDVMTYSEPGSEDGGRAYRRLGFKSEGIVTKPGFSCEKLRLTICPVAGTNLSTEMDCKLAIFDLDGTLLDTLGDLGEAVNHAIGTRGYPTHQMPEFRQMVGSGVRKLVYLSLPEDVRENQDILAPCLADFLSWYKAHIDIKTVPYEGMPELLQTLVASGVKVAVASNKFIDGATHLMGRYYPDIPWTAVLGERPGLALKPAPDMIQEIIATADVTPDQVFMIGDAGTDIQAAKAAGVRSIGCAWGFRPRADLVAAGADYILESPSDLYSILLPDETR